MKFYELSPEDRRRQLTALQKLSEQTLSELTNQALPTDMADHLIENQFSETELPMGACFIRVNGKNYTVPMTTEEPSVIAAANYGAKMADNFKVLENKRLMIGQIVFYKVSDNQQLCEKIRQKETEIFETARKAYPSIYARGGGLQRLQFGGPLAPNFVSVEFFVDTKDAMGANIINTMLEAIADKFREWFPAEQILFSILSNRVPDCQTSVETRIPAERIGSITAKKIALASEFAALDTSRRATHNKGVMNGIEAAALALGNDTRALYAALNWEQPLTSWTLDGGELIGQIQLSLPIATQGGATNLLPKAKAAFEILGTRDAKEVAGIIASLGLAQNLAALRALVSEGIQKGHMTLQARTLAMRAGATGTMIDTLARELLGTKRLTLATAEALLNQLKNQS